MTLFDSNRLDSNVAYYIQDIARSLQDIRDALAQIAHALNEANKK